MVREIRLRGVLRVALTISRLRARLLGARLLYTCRGLITWGGLSLGRLLRVTCRRGDEQHAQHRYIGLDLSHVI